MSDRAIFTYQTRLDLAPEQAAILEAYADLYGRAERSLFAAIRAGGSINDLKRAFQPRFGISARQFNAIRVGLEGKIAAIKERRHELITETEWRIRKAAKVVTNLEKRAPGSNKLHQKKRRLKNLQDRLATLKANQEAGTVRICFGGKKLFRAQFDLEANGYTDHGEWRADWQRKRSGQFFVLGSQDETAGNQSCQASVTEDGALNLQIRLPGAMAVQGKHLIIENVRFAYGHEQIVAALGTSQRIHGKTKDGKPTIKRIGAALSYRFVRDDKGWRIFVSMEARRVGPISRKDLGAIGVDVNADHLAVSETDRHGNWIGSWRINLNVYGKTTDQAKAIIGDAAVAIAAQAQAAGKPIVVEALNFQKKKAELETTDPKQARLISSFACNKVVSSIKAAAFRRGVEVIEVNPAYTSVIGAVNHAQVKGISVHQGAAYAIARRGLGFSERPTVRQAIVPVRNGGHVTFDLPERNRSKHVWSFWSGVRTKLKAAHAAHYRSDKVNALPAPLISATQSVCSHRSLPAKFWYANRDQHCSDHVQDDIPW